MHRAQRKIIVLDMGNTATKKIQTDEISEEKIENRGDQYRTE